MSVEYRPSFIGTGSAHPKEEISNEQVGDLVAEHGRKDLIKRNVSEDRIEKRLQLRREATIEIADTIGINKRWYAGSEESTSTIGVEAAHNALEASGIAASDVRGVILSTGLGDYMGTATAAIIAKELGVPENAMTHDLSAACVGFAHAAYEAFTNLTSPMSLDGPILIVSSETISRGMHPDKKSTIPIFGDGAGAVVVGLVETESEEPWPYFEFGHNAEHILKLYLKVGGSVEPVTPETLDEDRGVFMDNQFVFEYASEKMIKAGSEAQEGLEDFNKALGKSFNGRPILIPHQANLLIIKDVAKALGFSDEDSVVNIENWANTGSAAIPIALDEAIRSGKIGENDSFLGVTFGSGILWAGFIVHMYGLSKKWQKFPHGQTLTSPVGAK